jgi:hypothetical protein
MSFRGPSTGSLTAIAMAKALHAQPAAKPLKQYGAPKGFKDVHAASTASMARWVVSDDGGARQTDMVVRDIESLVDLVQSRIESVKDIHLRKDLVNYDPYVGVAQSVGLLRAAIGRGVALVDKPVTAALPFADGAVPLSHPVANALTWAIATLGRSATKVKVGWESNPDIVPKSHRDAVRAVDQLIDEYPPAQALYVDLMRGRVGPRYRERAFDGHPWFEVAVPTVNRGHHDAVDEATADPAALRKALFMPKPVRDAYHALLTEVRTKLDQGSIIHWLTGGTLLGAMRHGDMIPWDDDIDICVRPDPGESTLAFETRLRRVLDFPYVLEAAPIFGYKVYSSQALTEEQRRFCLFGVFIDLFVMEPFGDVDVLHSRAIFDDGEGGRRLHPAYPDAAITWPGEVWRADQLMPMVPAVFGPQRRIKVPTGARSYLDVMYTTDWEHTCVVPRASHGRTLAKELRFSRAFAEKAITCGAE